jgi:hypothetical protein
MRGFREFKLFFYRSISILSSFVLFSQLSPRLDFILFYVLLLFFIATQTYLPYPCWLSVLAYATECCY